MNQGKKPEMFYKDDLCKAVCGHSFNELYKLASEKFNEINNRLESFGRDMPDTRDEGDKAVDKFFGFMSCSFRFPLLDKSPEELYESFRKFREYELYLHPRSNYPTYVPVNDRIYSRIEIAYKKGNLEEFKEGVLELIDLFIHD